MRLRAQTVNPRHRRFAGLNGVPDCAELHQTGDLDLGRLGLDDRLARLDPDSPAGAVLRLGFARPERKNAITI